MSVLEVAGGPFIGCIAADSHREDGPLCAAGGERFIACNNPVFVQRVGELGEVGAGYGCEPGDWGACPLINGSV